MASIRVVERRGVDDPVGAISVHGVCGTFGVLALGLFADGTYGAGWNGVDGAVKGLFSGDAGQLAAQTISMVVLWTILVGLVTVFFRLQNAITAGGIRSRLEDEAIGLDVPELGVPGYVMDDEPDLVDIRAGVPATV